MVSGLELLLLVNERIHKRSSLISFQIAGKIDMIVMTAGTGGTAAGIGRKLKEKLPHIQVRSSYARSGSS